MGFSISKFRENYQITSPADFTFTIQSIPIGLANISPFINTTQLHYLASNASVPSRNLQTNEVQYQYETARKIPYATGNETLNVQFLEIEGMEARRFFEQWIDFILPQFGSNGQNYLAAYYDTYITSAKIEKYDRRGGLEMTWIYDEIYPVGISQIDLSWDAVNVPLMFQVDFTYQRYRVI